MGSQCSAEEFYIGKTNRVGYNKIFPLHFKSVWFEHDYGNKRVLRSSDWAGNNLTVEVNGEGKRKVAWKKRGLRNSLLVTRDQKEYVSSSLRDHHSSLVGSGNQVGLPVFPGGPEPTGPMRLEVGESPTVGDPRLLRLEAQAPVMFHQEASEAQDNSNAFVIQVKESPAPPVKAGTARHQNGSSSGTVCHQDGSLATQTDMDRRSAKVSAMVGGPFSDGICARASSAVWDRADAAFSHTTRSDLVYFGKTTKIWDYNKGRSKSFKWASRGASNPSVSQSLNPILAQNGLGSSKFFKGCFSGPSIHEMGEPSSLYSPIALTHSETSTLDSSDKPESLLPTDAESERQVQLLMLISGNYSDRISSDRLTMAERGIGINSDGLAAKLMEYNRGCLGGISSDSHEVDGLEVGTSSDGPVVALMEISAGFNSVGPAEAQMVLNGSFGDGLSSDDSSMVTGKTDMANSQLSKGIFLADILKRLSVAGLVDFGVKSADKGGSESSMLLIQGMDNKGTRLIDMGEIGQPNSTLMEPNSECGLFVLGGLAVEEVALSKVVSGEEENLADCNPLLTIIPLRLDLSLEVHNNSEVLDMGGTLDVSNWVKNRIPSFSKMIGLSMNRHEKLCIAYLQRLEREMAIIN